MTTKEEWEVGYKVLAKAAKETTKAIQDFNKAMAKLDPEKFFPITEVKDD